MPAPLYRASFAAASLLRAHPPRFGHPSKAALFALAYPPGASPAPAAIQVTRWPQQVASSFPLLPTMAVDIRPDFYDYTPVGERGPTIEWHVNFADPRLFCAYGSRLFAQDEMQVAEHPLLACVREGLLARNLSDRTTDHGGATPILVRNVERRIAVATDANAAAGRPAGLYGNRFADAPFEVIRRATRTIEPPTITNLIAMAAPSGGHGDYSARDIEYVFATAFTAFAAAVSESGDVRTVIHTGFWGCGAFGGDRRLMVALQVMAARATGIGDLVLHAGDAAGVDDARRGVDTADDLAIRCGSPTTQDEVIARAEMLACKWGVSDGN